MQTAQPSLHKHNLYLVRSRSGRKWRDRGMKVLAAPLLVACPKWPSHHVLARGNRSFAARVSRVAARGLVEDKPLVRENRSRPGFLARVIHVRYNSIYLCRILYRLARYATTPPARARGPSAAVRRPRRRIRACRGIARRARTRNTVRHVAGQDGLEKV